MKPSCFANTNTITIKSATWGIDSVEPFGLHHTTKNTFIMMKRSDLISFKTKLHQF